MKDDITPVNFSQCLISLANTLLSRRLKTGLKLPWTHPDIWIKSINKCASHKSHNALAKYPTMHHFVTEMCTHVHISATKWCIVGYGTDALWDLWNHRENSPVTQTSPEPTLLSWGGGPHEKIFPHPWPQGKPGLIMLIEPLRPYCSQSPLILLRCITEIKFAQNLRWLGNWH